MTINDVIIILCLSLIAIQGLMWRMIDNTKKEVDEKFEQLFMLVLNKFLETDKELTNLKEKNKKNGTTKEV